jgi:hypothetical protein
VTVYSTFHSSCACRVVSRSTRGFGPGLRGAKGRPSRRSRRRSHRSSAEPSPQTPPGYPRASVISNWQAGDILIGRLHAKSPITWLMENQAHYWLLEKLGRRLIIYRSNVNSPVSEEIISKTADPVSSPISAWIRMPGAGYDSSACTS